MILHLDMRILLLDLAGKLGKEGRTSDSCHILETDLVATILYDLVHHTHVIFNGMDRRIGDRKRHLRDHTSFLCIFDTETKVPVVIQTAERTRYVSTLCMFNLIHKLTHISRNRVHAESVKASLEHMSLDAGLMEWSRPFAYSLVWILSEEKVHLLECTSIGLDTVEAAHIDDGRSHFLQLCDSRNIFS